MGDLTVLTLVQTETQAEMICALLRTAGLEAFHRQTNAGAGAADGMPQVGAREVLVAAADLEDARAALDAEPEAT